MPALNVNSATLLDLTRRLNPDGKIAAIAEVLNQQNELLQYLPWVEGNGTASHKTTIRTGIPEGTFRLLNYGVQPVKSTTKQVTDSMGMLENYSEVDKALADLNGNTSEFRLSEDYAFIEGMNQTFKKTFVYGNTSIDSEKFTGIEARYNQKAGMAANTSGDNVILAGGAGAGCTSIYLLVLGENTIHGIYPKGSMAGLQANDKGQVTIENAGGVAGARMEAYRTHYKWDCGISVRDWRYGARIANIKISELVKDASAGADLIDFMAQALETVQDLTNGTPVFIMNRTMRTWLRRQMMNRKNTLLTLEQIAGKSVLHFDGVPCVRVDEILSTETAIS